MSEPADEAAEGAGRLRPAGYEDLPRLQEIYAHHVLTGTASFELEPPDLPEFTRRYESFKQSGMPYLLAELDGRILGYAYAGPYRPRPGYRFCVEDSVYVAPEGGGKGLGSALLGRLIEDCTAAGFRKMVAIIGDSANVGSIALHARHGFVVAGCLRSVGFKHGRWLDSVLMDRWLGEGDRSLPRERPLGPAS
jgi:L-amino acid N-acyltransferase YncA